MERGFETLSWWQIVENFCFREGIFSIFINIWKKTCIFKREGCIIWPNKMIKIPGEVFNSASSKKPLACHLHILMTSEREIMLFHPWF